MSSRFLQHMKNKKTTIEIVSSRNAIKGSDEDEYERLHWECICIAWSKKNEQLIH